MTEAERERVREQMERLLETSHFKNSRRYPALFRFIVEETLEGRGEYLKERLLGVRVFNRPPDYDTATDPIVRVTIAEIRKRIAQYYHDEAHDAEMRIELLPGRYAPEFRSRREAGPERYPYPYPSQDPSEDEGHNHAQEPGRDRKPGRHHEPGRHHDQAHEADPSLTIERAPPPLHAASPAAQPLFRPRRPRLILFTVAAVALVLGVVTALALPALLRWLQPTAMEELWAPVMGAPRPVLVVIPAGAGKSFSDYWTQPNGPTTSKPKAPTPTFLDHEELGENVVFSDALAALAVGDLLAVHRRDYRVRLSTLTTLNDMREGPSVLIGGMDNQWTMGATAPLPLHFAGNDETGYWIADTHNPGNHSWLLNLRQQYATVTRDYAIVSRVHNEQTGQPQIILAGIGMSGTAAAGEFLVDPRQAEQLRRRIGAGFKDRDFEAVLSTDVVNGIAGSPRILYVTVW